MIKYDQIKEKLIMSNSNVDTLYNEVMESPYLFDNIDIMDFNNKLKSILSLNKEEEDKLKLIIDKVIHDNPDIKEYYFRSLSFSAYLIKDTTLPKSIIEHVVKKHKIKFTASSGLEDKNSFMEYLLGEDIQAVKNEKLPLSLERFKLAKELGFKHKLKNKSIQSLYYTLGKRKILNFSNEWISEYMTCLVENDVICDSDVLSKIITESIEKNDYIKLRCALTPFIKSGELSLPEPGRFHYKGESIRKVLTEQRKDIGNGNFDTLVNVLHTFDFEEENKKLFNVFIVSSIIETPGFVNISGDELINKTIHYINTHFDTEEQKKLKVEMEGLLNYKIRLIRENVENYAGLSDEEIRKNGSFRVINEVLANGFISIEREMLSNSISDFEKEKPRSLNRM